MDISVSSSIPSLPHHQHRVHHVIRKQVHALQHKLRKSTGYALPQTNENLQRVHQLRKAYTKCGEYCAEHGSNFYLGTFLLTPERRKAAWAIHAWGLRIDDLIDESGLAESNGLSEALEAWEQRLKGIFKGKPDDVLDQALADTVSKFSLDIEPFQDVIDGMRMDLIKSRYASFDELYLYCYNVSGTVSMMLIPILGLLPKSQPSVKDLHIICHSAVSLGVAVQLTNILRDVVEDAARGRIYLPQDELKVFGLSEEDVFSGRVTENWRAFTKNQVQRARRYFNEAEKVVYELDRCSRWPVCASLSFYQQILDTIEANDYDNLTVRPRVSKWKKLASLPHAFIRAIFYNHETMI